MAVIGHDQHIYCCIECLRRHCGVVANPYRFAFAEEYADFCHGCDVSLDSVEVR